MLVMALLSATAVSTYWANAVFGWFTPTAVEVPPANLWIVWMVILVLLTVTAWSLIGNFEAIYKREQFLRQQLDLANEALSEQLDVRTTQLNEVGETLAHVRTDYENASLMATIAAAVPGVAHDLNTPVGNTNMAVSTLHHHVREFEAVLASGNLRKSEMRSFMDSLISGLTIIERANARAAELVSSLKELSTDQASNRRRQFDVAEVIQDVVWVMTPSLRKSPAKIFQNIETGLVMDSYPGALEQVLTNLIQNTVVHAFDGRNQGTITITSESVGPNQIKLTVEDDGIGMSDEICQRIFEPYFTTKLGKGGSGVGLSLCKRLTLEVLAGDLSVESMVGAGSKFTLVLPSTAPERVAYPILLRIRRACGSKNILLRHVKVETEAQRQFLADNGCLAYQGHLFARPVPVNKLEQYLRQSAQATTK
jgi:signal transduction histidine kinase